VLLDPQTGIFSLVRDFQPDEFKNTVLGLADSAKYFQLTTSLEQGPNGPILEDKAMGREDGAWHEGPRHVAPPAPK
jgi:hypothetical protein